MSEASFIPKLSVDHESEKEAEKKFSIEQISDPESPSLKEFYEFLGTIFDPADLEPIESYQQELGRKDSDVHFLCFTAKDAKGKVVSCAYGSLIKDIFAGRFIATEVSQRGTGISQKINLSIIEEAKKIGEINSIVGEAVEQSESNWNRLEIFEAGNSARRLYYVNPNTGEPDSSQQVFYRLPPFEWNQDGTPVSDPRQTENLQIAVKGCMDKIPVEKLEEILRLWWQTWYVRPKEQFESDEAFKKHENYVMGVLENEIVKPMKDSGQEFIMPMSKKERLKKEDKKNEKL